MNFTVNDLAEVVLMFDVSNTFKSLPQLPLVLTLLYYKPRFRCSTLGYTQDLHPGCPNMYNCGCRTPRTMSTCCSPLNGSLLLRGWMVDYGMNELFKQCKASLNVSK